MRAIEGQLRQLPVDTLGEQIRMLASMARHVQRVLAAAHRARKRVNREARA